MLRPPTLRRLMRPQPAAPPATDGPRRGTRTGGVVCPGRSRPAPSPPAQPTRPPAGTCAGAVRAAQAGSLPAPALRRAAPAGAVPSVVRAGPAQRHPTPQGPDRRGLTAAPPGPEDRTVRGEGPSWQGWTGASRW
jgi:hypothetical protein